MTLEKIQALGAHLTVGNIAAGASVTAGRLTRLNPARQYRYNVFFSARNGFWVQLLRVRTDEAGTWKIASRVTRRNDESSKEVTLYESIDKGFPLNPSGQVDW